ncbi:hypothetical protein BH09ACT10_BH09ACT10_10920 [soil metagenome]
MPSSADDHDESEVLALEVRDLAVAAGYRAKPYEYDESAAESTLADILTPRRKRPRWGVVLGAAAAAVVAIAVAVPLLTSDNDEGPNAVATSPVVRPSESATATEQPPVLGNAPGNVSGARLEALLTESDLVALVRPAGDRAGDFTVIRVLKGDVGGASVLSVAPAGDPSTGGDRILFMKGVDGPVVAAFDEASGDVFVDESGAELLLADLEDATNGE